MTEELHDRYELKIVHTRGGCYFGALLLCLHPMTKMTLAQLLLEELERRKAVDASYSMRRFARELDLDPSHISKILKGQRPLPISHLEKISAILKLSNTDVVRLRNSYLPPNLRLRPTKELEFKKYNLMSDWLSISVWCYMQLDTKVFSKETAALDFGVTEKEIEKSLEILTEVGLISPPTETGQSELLFSEISVLPPEPGDKRDRRTYLDFAAKGLEALQTVPHELRDQSSVTLAIDSNQLPQARLLMRKFRLEMMELLENSGTSNQVYHLNIEFFPLTKK